MYSAVVSPSNKCCPMIIHVRLKYVAEMNNEYK
jgi:hypothetical protein